MARKADKSGRMPIIAREQVSRGSGETVRDTIVKSSLTGVAATVAAVTICSPAGFGEFIGTGFADDTGLSNALSASGPASAFPEVRAPITDSELTDIRSRLRDSESTLDRARRETDGAIEMLRQIAAVDDDGGSVVASGPRASDVELARLLLSSRTQNG